MSRLESNLRPALFAFLRGLLLTRGLEAGVAAAILGDWSTTQTAVYNAHLERLLQQVICIAADPEAGGAVSGEFADMCIRDANSMGFDRVMHWMNQRRETILDAARTIVGESAKKES